MRALLVLALLTACDRGFEQESSTEWLVGYDELRWIGHACGPDGPEPGLYEVPIGASPVFGSPTAKVTLVMAMEFACPFSQRTFGTVDELRMRYGDDLRVVYKTFVVHPEAWAAARAACAANKQGKWREMADFLWTNAFEKRHAEPDAFEPARIEELARRAQLDIDRYRNDVGGVCLLDELGEHLALAKLGVRGVPSFFINGRYTHNGPIEHFTPLIDEEMAKATAATSGER